MPVVGILAPTPSPDDDAVFVDIKTAWVIAGIGHGHDDVVRAGESQAGEGASGEDGAAESRAEEDAGSARTHATAAASTVEFQRITPDNIDSFHFHGDTAAFPVSAAIVVPPDARSATILLGRYLDRDIPVQLVRPAQVVEGLVDRVFRIRTVLDAVTAIVALAALAALGLAVFLSFRLRAREIDTAIRLGARQGMVFRMLATEAAMVVFAAALVAGLAAPAVGANAEAWVAWLLALGA